MSDKPRFDIMTHLRFWVASFAMWFCGCPTLFWTDPEAWEEYMSMGEPYVATSNANEPDPYVLQEMYDNGYARGRDDAAALEKMREPTP